MSIVLGYHGCRKSVASALLGGDEFRSSVKAYDWLGTGSYFWEWDVIRAHEWAERYRATDPCVVGAVIETGHCLDLTTRAGVKAVELAYKSFVLLQDSTEMPQNEDSRKGEPGNLAMRYLDKAVIDHLHSNYKSVTNREFDTVRALFPEGKPLYDNAGFWDKTHVQLAVRKPSQILGVFRIPKLQQDELGIQIDY